MDHRRSEPRSSAGQAIGGLAVLLGVLCLGLLPISTASVLQHFADDKVVDVHGLRALRLARIQIIGLGSCLVLLGLACRRWRLLRFLDAHDQAARWILLLLIGGALLGIVEVFFQIRPIPSTEDRLRRSVAYDVSAFSINRLAAFDQDVEGAAPGSTRFRIRNGYRGPDFPPQKPSGEIRIVILGGSFVFDILAEGDEDWPDQVDVLLEEGGLPQVRVINAGVPGHSTFDAIGRLTSEIHYYDPDIVALCCAWNDIKYFNQIDARRTPLRHFRPMPRPTHEHYPPSKLRQLLDDVHLFRIAAAVPGMFARFGEEGRLPEGEYSDSVSPIGLAQYALNVRNFVDICRNIGAEPILITEPHLPLHGNRDEVVGKIRYDWALLSHDALCQAFAGCGDICRAIGREKDCRVVEISASLSGRPELFADHVHLTRQGSRAVAEHVAASFAEALSDSPQAEHDRGMESPPEDRR